MTPPHSVRRRSPSVWPSRVLRWASWGYVFFFLLTTALFVSACATGADARVLFSWTVQAGLWATLLLLSPSRVDRGGQAGRGGS